MNRFQKWIHGLCQSVIAKVPKWDTLIQMSRNKIVNSSYLFLFITPIAAKVTRHLPEVVEIPLGSGYQFTIGLPFSWLWLFWCALAASLANVIVLFRCPEIVSKYREWADFERSARGNDQLDRYALSPMCNDFPFDRIKISTGSASGTSYRSEKEGYYYADRTTAVREVEARNFNGLRDFHEQSRRVWRMGASGLYLIAISCFCWLTLKNIWFVAKYMMN